jgi:hypothetical protein
MASLLSSNGTDIPCWQHEGFGPIVWTSTCAANGRDGFDFTLLFEQGVMSVGSSVLLLLAGPLRWIQLRSQSRKTEKGEMWGWGKLVRHFFQRNESLGPEVAANLIFRPLLSSMEPYN